MHDPTILPEELPAPVDDGAADHLVGLALPHALLRATTGGLVDLAELARDRLVLYIYPRTGKPGEDPPPGWDEIPGARGCTPQACAYRDTHVDFERLGYVVAGLSAQPVDEQTEAARRLHLPFTLLSDPNHLVGRDLKLPTFQVAGMHLYRRLTCIAERGHVVKVFYPIFPASRDASDVLAWINSRDLQMRDRGDH